MITNYSTLQTAVLNFTRNSGLSSMIPELIQLGETDIDCDLSLGGDEIVNASLPTVAGNAYVDLPTDFRSARAIWNEDPRHRLTLKTPEQVAALSPFGGGGGYPESYSIVGKGADGTYRLFLGPVPQAIYALDMFYCRRRAGLASVSTNWLLTRYPNLFLFATLRNAAAFLIDDPRVGLWEAGYQQMVTKVKKAEEDILWAGDTPTMEVDVYTSFNQ